MMASYKNAQECYDDAIAKGLIPMSEYTGFNDRMEFACVKCNRPVKILPRSVAAKTGYGCRCCATTMSENEFIDKVNKINEYIEIISPYINSKTKVKCRCKICNYIWERKPNDILSGHHSCPRCIDYQRMTQQEFYDEVAKMNLSFDVLSEYINRRTPVLCRCKLDGYEWYAYPYDILRGRCGCARCNKNEHYTTDQFREIMSSVNNSILIIGEYIDSKTPLQCECAICGAQWFASPSNLKNNLTGCPECRLYKSKGEELLESYLSSHNINFIRFAKFDGLKGVGGRPLSYDFYLPECKILFECQGEQHYKPIGYFGGEEKYLTQQEHDRRKREYAQSHNIQLIEIKYDEYKKINCILDKIFNNAA